MGKNSWLHNISLTWLARSRKWEPGAPLDKTLLATQGLPRDQQSLSLFLIAQHAGHENLSSFSFLHTSVYGVFQLSGFIGVFSCI